MKTKSTINFIKYAFCGLFLFGTHIAIQAQVGVGTTDPKATLDVIGDAATASSIDGIIIPRLTADQLAAKTGYGQDQNGTIVYVSLAPTSTLAGEFVNVTTAGFYFYSHDGSTGVWNSLGSSSSSSLISADSGNSLLNFTLSDGVTNRIGDSIVSISDRGRITANRYQLVGNASSGFVSPGTRRYDIANGDDATVPTAITNNQFLGIDEVTGYNGTSFERASVISTLAIGDWTETDMSSRVNISGTDADITLEETGNIKLGTSSKGGLILPVLNSFADVENLETGLTIYCSGCSTPGMYIYNGSGFVSTSSTTGTPEPDTAPVIDFSSTTQGATLTAVDNYDANGSGSADSFTYQWLRADDPNGTNQAAIAGATSSTYVVAAADVDKWISVEITAVSGMSNVVNTSDFIPAEFTFGGLSYSAVRGGFDQNNDGVGDNVWLDRNLGATQVATSLTGDNGARGWFYQWGRASDGHQIRTSGTFGVNGTDDAGRASTFLPNQGNAWDGLFILRSNKHFVVTPLAEGPDLWAGDRINNPCPAGFGVPDDNVFENEITAFSGSTPADAFSSPLKFSIHGFRNSTNGNFNEANRTGSYWTSGYILNHATARYLDLDNTDNTVSVDNNHGVRGRHVRCVRVQD